VDATQSALPKGWREGVIADLGEIICGKTPPTSDPANYGTDIPFVTIPDMHGKMFVTRTGKSLSQQGANTQPTKTLPPYSICVSCIATPGLVILTSQPCQTNQQINSVVPNTGYSPFYCYFALRELSGEIRSRGSGGSVTANLNKGDFAKIPIALPPVELSKQFQELTEPVFKRILSNEHESRTLAALRDALLPKLLSSELRVPAKLGSLDL
jgi:type I restriction enzyme S subunit